jgi:hypothetical protein
VNKASQSHKTALPANKPMQPTPLRGPKIVAILKVGFTSTALPIYDGGAANVQAVGQPSVPAAINLHIPHHNLTLIT